MDKQKRQTSKLSIDFFDEMEEKIKEDTKRRKLIKKTNSPPEMLFLQFKPDGKSDFSSFNNSYNSLSSTSTSIKKPWKPPIKAHREHELDQCIVDENVGEETKQKEEENIKKCSTNLTEPIKYPENNSNNLCSSFGMLKWSCSFSNEYTNQNVSHVNYSGNIITKNDTTDDPVDDDTAASTQPYVDINDTDKNSQLSDTSLGLNQNISPSIIEVKGSDSKMCSDIEDASPENDLSEVKSIQLGHNQVSSVEDSKHHSQGSVEENDKTMEESVKKFQLNESKCSYDKENICVNMESLEKSCENEISIVKINELSFSKTQLIEVTDNIISNVEENKDRKEDEKSNEMQINSSLILKFDNEEGNKVPSESNSEKETQTKFGTQLNPDAKSEEIKLENNEVIDFKNKAVFSAIGASINNEEIKNSVMTSLVPNNNAVESDAKSDVDVDDNVILEDDNTCLWYSNSQLLQIEQNYFQISEQVKSPDSSVEITQNSVHKPQLISVTTQTSADNSQFYSVTTQTENNPALVDTKCLQETHKKLRDVIQEISHLNAILLKARKGIWPHRNRIFDNDSNV